MEPWLKISIWVAIYGFLKEFQPIDPYITIYLTQPPMNFTREIVMHDIFPIATYVSFVELVLVFLLTDWLRYRPIIFVNAVSSILMMVILIWGRSLRDMLFMEFCFGTTMSTEIAYYTYIYTKVDKDHYQAVTSYMRSSSLMGRFFACLLAGFVSLTEYTSKYTHLLYLQLAVACITLSWAFLLPAVQTSLYFYRYPDADDVESVDRSSKTDEEDTFHRNDDKSVESAPLTMVGRRLWHDFKYAYTNLYTLKWSLWWAFNLCGFNQETTYAQSLWINIAEIAPTNEAGRFLLKYTGFAEGAFTIVGAAAAFGVSCIQVDWVKRGNLMMAMVSLLEGFLVLWASQTDCIFQAFISHILFSAVYYSSSSVAYSEIARHIPSDSYALIFGINTFIGLILQSILTAIFHGRGGFELASRQQFYLYGCYFLAMGSVFLVKVTLSAISRMLKKPANKCCDMASAVSL